MICGMLKPKIAFAKIATPYRVRLAIKMPGMIPIQTYACWV